MQNIAAVDDCREIIVSVERRKFLKAIAGGAGLASVQGLFPAWAQTGARGIAPTVTTLSGPDIALTVGHTPFSFGGRTGHAVTVNGTLPAPLLRLREGQRARLSVTNTLDEDTSIHWHGVLLPFQMDGVPGISQPPVKKGESFTYDFVVPDASLYWYHPHVMSNAQVGFGLYGPLLVEDPDDGVNVADETTLVLSDIGFDSKGVLEDPESGGSAGMVFGREGSYVLVNGRTHPTIKARSGALQRWRIVNTAKDRKSVV